MKNASLPLVKTDLLQFLIFCLFSLSHSLSEKEDKKEKEEKEFKCAGAEYSRSIGGNMANRVSGAQGLWLSGMSFRLCFFKC